ncbi:nucleoside-triphosphate diphosphatase [Aureococcus anophagefferens]|uniref:Nucleoside-triphosphate diphosphatase n=1 Tax=Aureococcus anophagefferens TaxID=44056 RepID=A0ABR1FRW2_AURAN
MRGLRLVGAMAAFPGARALTAPPAITLDAARACAVAMPEDAPRIVMGSKSASRRALLAAMGCADFEVRVPDIDEKAIGDRRGDPASLVAAVAVAKCDALLARHFARPRGRRGAVLVHGDQVVTFDGSIREKPEDLAEARRFAASYGGASCGTTGCVVVHDVRTNRHRRGPRRRVVDFGAFPPGLVDEILAADGDIVMACAGGLMVEHRCSRAPRASPRARRRRLMGLSTPVLARLVARVAADRAADERAHPLTSPALGPVLGRPARARRWAVVGDVHNGAKAASRVLAKLGGVPVSPYGDAGGARTFADVAGPVDAVNLVVSPKIGERELEAIAASGTRYVFLQPGADGARVVLAARRLGLVVQRGCVLVDEFPAADAA